MADFSPRVSVVMPVHNAEGYVGDAVRSALDPRLPEVEVLVVDDGSTDGSVAEVRTIADPRIRIIQLPASGGPAKPRNVGVSHSRAPYISLLDADDLLKPGKLASSAAALDRHLDAGFAFSDYERIDGNGNVFEVSVFHRYPVLRAIRMEPAGEGWSRILQADLARGMVKQNFIGTSSMVIRKSLLSSLGGFDETLANCDDLDLWFRLAHSGDALYSPTIGHAYRAHAASITYRSPLRTRGARIAVLLRERDRWRDPTARRDLDRFIAGYYDEIGQYHRRQRERRAALRAYLQAYRHAPRMSFLRALLATPFLDPENEQT